MEISKAQQESIDAYLREELKGEALQIFEAALVDNELLKKELIFQQSLAKAARLKSVKEAMAQARINNLLKNKKAHPQFEVVQDNMKKARAKTIKYQRQQKVKRWLIGGAVAACTLLMVFGGWTSHLKKDVAKELSVVFEETGIIADQFTKVPPNIKELVGGREEVIRHKLEQLKKARSEKRFDEAFKLLKVLREQYDYQPDELIYYEADLYAQTGEYTKSTEILRKLIEQNSEIENEARWFTGLLYLKTNEKTKAKKEFKILLQQSEKHKAQAQQKLKKHYLL